MQATLENQLFIEHDYSVFKPWRYNRHVQEAHVKHLMAAIKKRNMSDHFPVLVNERMEIVDGQHRFEALKRLELPIVYKVMPDSKIDDLHLINANVKTWSSGDYVHFYAKRGRKDYIRLGQDLREHKVTLAILEQIFKARFFKDNLASGNFQYPEEYSVKVTAFFQELEIFNRYSFYKHLRFVRAYAELRGHENYDPDQMQHQVKTYPFELDKQGSWVDYYKALSNLYNYRRQKNKLKAREVEKGEY